MDSQKGTTSKNEGQHAKWNDTTTAIFVGLCEDEIKKGTRPNTHFNRDGWRNLINGFYERTLKLYTRQQLKNRWDTMKDDYKLWKLLNCGESGIGWDYVNNTFEADDEWWNRKIKDNPKYAKFRNKDLKLIKERYCLLFDDILAMGELAWTPNLGPAPSTQRPTTMIIDEDEEVGDFDNAVEVNEDNNFDESQKIEFGNSAKARDVSCGGQGNSRKKQKQSGSTSLGSQIDSLLNVMATKANAASSSLRETQSPTIPECIKLLDQIPCIAGTTLRNFALNLFFQREAREVFANQQTDDDRLSWLEYNFNREHPEARREM